MSTKKTCGMCGEVYADGLDKCPLCGGSGTDDLLGEEARTDVPLGEVVNVFADEKRPRGAGDPRMRSTEQLEAELRDRSAAIERHQTQFQQVRAELKRRRQAKDEQPTPREVTADQQRQDELDNLRGQVGVLSNKVIAMEAEQAKLVVEAELFKAQRVEAEEKLALVVKHAKAGAVVEKPTTTPHLEDMRRMLEKHAGPAPATREPLSRETAYKIALTHMNQAGIDGEPPAWAIGAIVEASR